MPSNRICINNAIQYSVSDNNMDELIQWLQEKGHIVENDDAALASGV